MGKRKICGTYKSVYILTCRSCENEQFAPFRHPFGTKSEDWNNVIKFWENDDRKCSHCQSITEPYCDRAIQFICNTCNQEYTQVIEYITIIEGDSEKGLSPMVKLGHPFCETCNKEYTCGLKFDVNGIENLDNGLTSSVMSIKDMIELSRQNKMSWKPVLYEKGNK
jgi:hypothetical protein